MAGGAAEEAGRKLKDLGIETQPAAPPPPSPEDLAAYGITPGWWEMVGQRRDRGIAFQSRLGASTAPHSEGLAAYGMTLGADVEELGMMAACC